MDSYKGRGLGGDVTITGGTVIAIAGGDCKARDQKGGSAIGCGQGMDNKDDNEYPWDIDDARQLQSDRRRR